MVVADDKTIEKKDKTADEPVQFYIKGATHPYEIVVFDVTKDKVNGYLSTPKDMGSARAPVAQFAVADELGTCNACLRSRFCFVNEMRSLQADLNV